jgi:DNA processing protein
MITAYASSSYGRDVFAVPGRISDIHSAGCNELIRKNIAAILSSPEDLIDYMNWNSQENTPKQLRLFPDLSPEEKNICEAIAEKGQIGIDELCNSLQKSISQLSSLLLELELKSAIISLPGKNYVLSSTSGFRTRP